MGSGMSNILLKRKTDCTQIHPKNVSIKKWLSFRTNLFVILVILLFKLVQTAQSSDIQIWKCFKDKKNLVLFYTIHLTKKNNLKCEIQVNGITQLRFLNYHY